MNTLTWQDRLNKLKRYDQESNWDKFSALLYESSYLSFRWQTCAVGEALGLQDKTKQECDQLINDHPHSAKLQKLGSQFTDALDKEWPILGQAELCLEKIYELTKD